MGSDHNKNGESGQLSDELFTSFDEKTFMRWPCLHMFRFPFYFVFGQGL